MPDPFHVDRDGRYLLLVLSMKLVWQTLQDVIGLTQAEVMGPEFYQHLSPT